MGAGITLLLRRGPRRRPTARMLGEARRVARGGTRGARRLAHRGEEVLGDAGEALGEYLDAAREAIDHTVSRELRDLRKAVRRRRKRLGL